MGAVVGRPAPEPWPFDQPPDAAAVTTRQVLDGAPILVVTHAADDHSWAFLCGTTDTPQDGRVIGMQEALNVDPTLRTVADLPPGWTARRAKLNAPFQRNPEPSSG